MRLLLDSNVLLWALSVPSRLNARTRAELEDRGNEILFSAASVWEIAIKAAAKPGSMPLDAQEVFAFALQTGFKELPVTSAVARHIADLPPLHRDPFDRLLIAQAMAEPAILLTSDAKLPAYSELVRLI